jgi:GNAT superfamily N-acetyltransferase
MEIHVRRASVEDLKHLVHHRLAMFEEMGYRDPLALTGVEKASSEYFSEALRSGTYVGWLAEKQQDGKVVAGGGVVVARWPGFPGENRAERAWILNMYTEPEARRQGVAKRLLELIVNWCRERGLSTVSLHASDFGRPLYEAAGFHPTNEMRLKLR